MSAFDPMEVTDGGIGSFFRFRHPSNKHSSIYSNEIGIDIFVNDSQFLNAQTPIDSTADGIAISHNFLQPLKDPFPMDATVVGISIELNDEQLKNELSDIQ